VLPDGDQPKIEDARGIPKCWSMTGAYLQQPGYPFPWFRDKLQPFIFSSLSMASFKRGLLEIEAVPKETSPSFSFGGHKVALEAFFPGRGLNKALGVWVNCAFMAGGNTFLGPLSPRSFAPIWVCPRGELPQLEKALINLSRVIPGRGLVDPEGLGEMGGHNIGFFSFRFLGCEREAEQRRREQREGEREGEGGEEQRESKRED